MRNLIFRNLLQLRQNCWFWPSMLTAFALLLGFTLPIMGQKAQRRKSAR